MTTTTTTLAAGFAPADQARWRALAEAALHGAPFDTLTALTRDGLAIAPLYTADDAPGAPFPAPVRAGPWRIRQRVAQPDAQGASADIHADLEGGADEIELAAPDGFDMAAALAGISAAAVPISLDAAPSDGEAAAAALAALLPEGATAGFGLDPLGAALRTGAACDRPMLAASAQSATALLARFPDAAMFRVDARAIHEAGGAPAQEIGAALALGWAYLEALLDAGLGLPVAARAIEFRLAVGPECLDEAAKLRALRLAWARLTEACGDAQPARLHAITSRRMLTRVDAWTNLVRTTAAAFAGVIGGADALTTLPLTEPLGLPDAFARRMARNTQLILLHECRLAAVADPAGGSWFVEAHTEGLAARGWEIFRALDALGGMADERARARLRADVAAACAQHAAAGAPITGVTDFPPPAGAPEPAFSPAPEAAPALLPEIRWSAAFEGGSP